MREFKICQKCKETKPFSEFHKHRREKDGLQGVCKVCMVEVNARIRQNRSRGKITLKGKRPRAWDPCGDALKQILNSP